MFFSGDAGSTPPQESLEPRAANVFREPAAHPFGMRGWSTAVGAAALVVLGACGGVAAVSVRRPGPPAGLDSASDWALAAALPTADDFPAAWNYTISGAVHQTSMAPEPSAAAGSAAQTGPRTAYEPPACGDLPAVLSHVGTTQGPIVGVDQSQGLVAARAESYDALATGQISADSDGASITIWRAPDGAARITNYVSWLRRCEPYRVTNYSAGEALPETLSVTTTIDSHSLDRTVAAIEVSITFADPDSATARTTYHAAFWALRGLIVEARMNLHGNDLDLMRRRAGETVQKLRAL